MTEPCEPTVPVLPIQQDWTRSEWERAVAGAELLTARGASLALSALRQIFPPSLTTNLQAARHPIVAHQLTHAGRAHLLELGIAAAFVRPGVQDVRRLRDPGEFSGIAAELRAGFMFSRAGMVLAPPPPGRCRCEYVAESPDGRRIAIESKLPDVTDAELDLARVEYEVLMLLMDQLRWLPEIVTSGFATFRFAPAIAELGDRHRLDQALAKVRVQTAGSAVAETLSVEPHKRVFELPRIGALVLREEPDVGYLQFDSVGVPRDAKRRSQQLRRNNLNDGLSQIRAAGAPGVIVVDAQRDGSVRNTLGFLQQWAHNKAGLAAVIVIDRHVIQDRLYGCVDLLPGPCFDDVSDLLWDLFDVCSDGHLHYSPLTSLDGPCPCHWLPRVA